MVDPVPGWFEVVRYDDKIAITIANLVETTWRLLDVIFLS